MLCPSLRRPPGISHELPRIDPDLLCLFSRRCKSRSHLFCFHQARFNPPGAHKTTKTDEMAAPSEPLWLDVYDTPYSNGTNYAADVLFLIIVCGCLTSCIAAAWKTRRCITFSVALCIAYILEIIAYALRLQSWYIVSYTTNFGLSLIAPVFITIA